MTDADQDREARTAVDQGRFEALFESIPEAVAHVVYRDGTPVVLTVNRAFEETFGFDTDEVVGEPLDEFVVPDHLAEEVRAIDDATLRGEPVEIETRRHTTDGLRDFILKSRPHAVDDDRIEALEIYVDITERKRRERELEQYEHVVETVGDGVYVVGPDRRFAMVNDEFAEMTGYDRDDLVGEYACAVFDRDAVEFANEMQRRFRTGDREVQTVEESLHTADGDVPVETRFTLFEFDDGAFGRVGVVRDLTDRRERERRVERQRDDLRALERVDALIQETIQALVRAPTREEIERTVCESLGSVDAYRFAWVGGRDVGERTTVAPRERVGVSSAYLETVVAADADGGVPAGEAVRTGELVVVQDVEASEEFDEAWREATLAQRYRSLVAVPLSVDRTAYGVLVLYAHRADGFSERELAALKTLGDVVGFAVDAVQNRRLLFADDVTELVLRFDDENVAMVDLSAELDCAITLDGVVPGVEGSTLCYLTVEDVDAETFLDAAADRHGVDGVRLVSDGDDAARVEVELVDGSAVRQLLAHGVTVRGATADRGVAEVTALLPSDAETDPRELVEAVGHRYSGTTLARKRTVDRPTVTADEFRESFRGRLTEKQRRALRAAYLGGYFEWPRESDAADVAASLDVSSPTLLYHLRRAQRALLDAYFEDF